MRKSIAVLTAVAAMVGAGTASASSVGHARQVIASLGTIGPVLSITADDCSTGSPRVCDLLSFEAPRSTVTQCLSLGRDSATCVLREYAADGTLGVVADVTVQRGAVYVYVTNSET